MLKSLTVPMGIASAMGLSLAAAAQGTPGVPVEIVPAVSLVALIGGAISMGMLFNRVKQLEKDREVMRSEDSLLRSRTHELASAIQTLTFTTEQLKNVTEQFALALNKLRP